MTVGHAYQLNPYGSLDPQQAANKPILQFQTQLGAVWQAIPPWIFKPSKQPNTGCHRPRVVISHAGQHCLFFVMTHGSHVHTNYKISTALAAKECLGHFPSSRPMPSLGGPSACLHSAWLRKCQALLKWQTICHLSKVDASGDSTNRWLNTDDFH